MKIECTFFLFRLCFSLINDDGPAGDRVSSAWPPPTTTSWGGELSLVYVSLVIIEEGVSPRARVSASKKLL